MRLAALAVFACLASPALADRLTVTCTSQDPPTASAQQTCWPNTEAKLIVPNRGTGIRLRFTAPATHCAQIIYHYKVKRADGGFVIGQTPPLAPGASNEQDLGAGFRPKTAVTILGVGLQGGCNEGFIHSWALDLETTFY